MKAVAEKGEERSLLSGGKGGEIEERSVDQKGVGDRLGRGGEHRGPGGYGDGRG